MLLSPLCPMPNNDSPLSTWPTCMWSSSVPLEPNKSDLTGIVFKIVMKQKVEPTRTVFICNCAAHSTLPSLPNNDQSWVDGWLGAEVWRRYVCIILLCVWRGGGGGALVSPPGIGRYILRSVLRGNVSCLSPPFVRLLMYHLGVQFNFVTGDKRPAHPCEKGEFVLAEPRQTLYYYLP